MSQAAIKYPTYIASLSSYRKGKLDIFGDNPRHYAFSNIFEVANLSLPFERVAVTKNHDYVSEVMKVEGESPWFTAPHDEFALVMDGEIEFVFIKPLNAESLSASRSGADQLEGKPEGTQMGVIRAKRGHLVLLPAQAAYHLTATKPSVVILQTIAGPLTRERWADICISN